MLTLALVIVTSVTQNAVLAQTPFGASRVSPEMGFMAWLLAQQAIFYRALSGAVRLAKTDGSALWTLMGIAFSYGVFHAAGPGHGKAVISSYLLANDETWRRGIALSFASALLQSLTAVLIVGIAAALLGATARMMSDAAHTIELISYGLIVLLGARLLWVKGLSFVRALAEFRDHRHHPDDDTPGHHLAMVHAHNAHRENSHDGEEANSHQHDHSHVDGHAHEPGMLPWGHAHGPEPQDLRGPGGWKRGLAAIVAVGLRPCSGAIILLVFALSQGLFWAGAVSTFVMGLGTAITVAAIATLAVAARTFAMRFASDEISLGSVLVRGMEVGAAGLVLALGGLLLAGYMASERLAFF
jgi:ABC-type nickel/cobalt efflux system permease component RcnA